MHATSKTILCKDCGQPFELSFATEQWYINRGLLPPVRCEECRRMRKHMKAAGRYPTGYDQPIAMGTCWPTVEDGPEPTPLPMPGNVTELTARTTPSCLADRYFIAKPITEGKIRPGNSAKFHVFAYNGVSLCGRHNADTNMANVMPIHAATSGIILCPQCADTLTAIQAGGS